MATYKLISAKGTRDIDVDTQAEAIRAAREMDEELQPAFGVSVEDDAGETIAEIGGQPAQTPEIPDTVDARIMTGYESLKALFGQVEPTYLATIGLSHAESEAVRRESPGYRW